MPKFCFENWLQIQFLENSFLSLEKKKLDDQTGSKFLLKKS